MFCGLEQETSSYDKTLNDYNDKSFAFLLDNIEDCGAPINVKMFDFTLSATRTLQFSTFNQNTFSYIVYLGLTILTNRLNSTDNRNYNSWPPFSNKD